jgi:hypothetical protein
MGGPAKALVASREVAGPRASLGGWATRLVDRLASRHERRVRETSAEALERAVEEVDLPLHRGGAAVAIDRPAVAEAAPLLLQVAARLRGDRPLPPEALRLVRSLTGDGAGPLYARSAHRSEYPPGTLGRYARTILALCDSRLPLPDPAHLVRG